MTRRVRLAVNGLGRTGRQVVRAIWTGHQDRLEMVAVGLRDLDDLPAVAHLLAYDSNYGRFPARVTVQDRSLKLDDHSLRVTAAPEPACLPWDELGVDMVIDATGAHTSRAAAEGHLAAGAKRVIVTAPCTGADLTIIYGLNETDYNPMRHRILATESGVANAAAVLLKVLDDSFRLCSAVLTAVHAYTNEQKLLDSPDPDLRRARAAPLSIVPASIDAVGAVELLFSHLKGRVSGYAVHVPVPTVSMLELTAQFAEPVSAAVLNDAFRNAASGPLSRVLAVSEEPLVSSDFIGDDHSAVVDAPLTVAVGPLAKIGAWFDNEWGYSKRVAEVAAFLAACET